MVVEPIPELIELARLDRALARLADAIDAALDKGDTALFDRAWHERQALKHRLAELTKGAS